MTGGSGTVRYLARHSLWRSLGGALSGLMQVAGLLLLALLAAAVYVTLRHPLVTVLLLTLWVWRRGRRRRVTVPVPTERDRLRDEMQRLRLLALRLKIGPDILAATRDYEAGRLSRRDYDVALQVAAEARQYRPTRFRFQH
jgi:hypothetical protein